MKHSSADEPERIRVCSRSGRKSETSTTALFSDKLEKCRLQTDAKHIGEEQRHADFLLQIRLLAMMEHVLEVSPKSIVRNLSCCSQVNTDWPRRKATNRLTLWQDCEGILRYTARVQLCSKQDKSTFLEGGSSHQSTTFPPIYRNASAQPLIRLQRTTNEASFRLKDTCIPAQRGVSISCFQHKTTASTLASFKGSWPVSMYCLATCRKTLGNNK